MNRETQVGLALAILFIGIVGAAFFRHGPAHPGDTQSDRNNPPVQDSRSESERPPASISPPRRARTADDPPRVTSARASSITPVQPELEPDPDLAPAHPTSPSFQSAPKPQPGRSKPPRTASRPVRISVASGEPPAPPLPTTRPPGAPPSPTPQQSVLAAGRQPGTPPPEAPDDVDRAPQRIRFVPSRHPLAGRRVLQPDR